MKKLVLATAASAAIALGFGGAAHAEDEAYPPNAPTETVVASGGTSTGALPATGSDGTSTMTLMAGGLLVVGTGLVGVSAIRRRQNTVAA